MPNTKAQRAVFLTPSEVAHLYGLAQAHVTQHGSDRAAGTTLAKLSDVWLDFEADGHRMDHILAAQRARIAPPSPADTYDVPS